jgi:predicted nicotinamide N-methyase
MARRADGLLEVALKMRARPLVVGGVSIELVEAADVDALIDRAIAEGTHAPYGAVLWTSGVVVAALLAEWPLQGRTLLELGAGTGIVSLVAAKRGARVLATDVDDTSLALVDAAAARQGTPIETRRFDIFSAEPLPQADVVIAADLLYEEPLAAALARRTIEARARGSDVVVGDPGRTFRARFEADLRAAGIPPLFELHRTTLAGDVPAHETQREASVLALRSTTA